MEKKDKTIYRTEAEGAVTVVGIDLGTTNTLISLYDETTGRASCIENGTGSCLTPSVIRFDEKKSENGTEYYIIKYKNDLFICFSYPLDDYFESYELLHDYSNIYKENIVNNEKSYTGAEIKYWFALNHDKKYDKFGKFLDSRSKHCLSDKLKYKVTIDKNNKYSIKII